MTLHLACVLCLQGGAVFIGEWEYVTIKNSKLSNNCAKVRIHDVMQKCRLRAWCLLAKRQNATGHPVVNSM